MTESTPPIQYLLKAPPTTNMEHSKESIRKTIQYLVQEELVGHRRFQKRISVVIWIQYSSTYWFA